MWTAKKNSSNRLVFTIGTCFFLLIFSIPPAYSVFEKMQGIEDASIQKIFVSKADDTLMYAFSSDSFFRSSNRGKTWEKVFVAKGEDIVDACLDLYLYDTVYFASLHYVYRMREGDIEKIFTAPPEITNTCIEKYNGTIYIGTTEGLYSGNEDSLRFAKVDNLPGDLKVYALGFSPRVSYVAADAGIYVSFEGEAFQKRLVFPYQESEEEEEVLLPRVLRVDAYQENISYLGTSRGLYASFDYGRNWRRVRISRIENSNIYCILQARDERNSLYLATDRGIFRVDISLRESQPLFEGLGTKNIFWLAFNRRGRLFAASARGLYRRDQISFSASSLQMEQILAGEPCIEDVHQAALRYNEVHPEKVKQWRKALKYRGFFPEVSLDYDKTIYGTYASGGQFAVGPQDWGVSFSWDVGDLIWNNYEDDVDTRSRLMTQLRINILDDINSIYFERLRVKMELMNEAYQDEPDRIKKEFRLRELTAALDGYTGGYFSRQAKALIKRGQ